MSNLFVTSGDSYTGERRLTVTVTDPDGSATDLTGVDLTFMVKRRRGDADDDALITKVVGAGQIEVTNAGGGIARITLAEANTASLAGRYYWELEADDAEGKLTLASGGFYVQADMITGA